MLTPVVATNFAGPADVVLEGVLRSVELIVSIMFAVE